MISQLVKELTVSAGKYNATMLKLFTVSESLRYLFDLWGLMFTSSNILYYENSNMEPQYFIIHIF